VTNTSRVNPEARIYTIGHELGHLVTRTDAACLEPEDAYMGTGSIERWCEEFAANLLMPASAVVALAESRRLRERVADFDDVSAVKNAFRVSARAAARRLIELGYAQEALYGAVLRAFAPKAPDSTGKAISPPRPEARIRQYGPGVIRTLLETLPSQDALSILRIDVEDARALAERVPGVPVP
jgi:Zn-dependent peptidase ImmA (M78 family)